MEAVNQATTGNQITLHTTADCEMNVKREMTGVVLSTDCLNSTDSNSGCGVQAPDDTYGQALNSIGGGVGYTHILVGNKTDASLGLCNGAPRSWHSDMVLPSIFDTIRYQ